MRTITADQARRSILTRQGLIQPFSHPQDAVRAMVAVQTQYATSLSVAVAARTAKPAPGWEDAALAVGGPLIKAWSVRHTLHAHLAEDHALLLGNIGDRAYARFLRFMAARRGPDIPTMESEIEAALDDGPLTREQLHARVPSLRNIDMVGWGLDVMGLAYRRRLCVTGRGSSQCFALLEPGEAHRDLGAMVRRYLEGFGPATLNDFSHWSGLPISMFRVAASQIDGLEAVQIEGMRGERLAIAGSLDDVPGSALGVRLLAKFDPLVLAHKDKSLFLANEHRSRVLRPAAQVEAVVLSEGQACATWRLERKGKRAFFTIEPFRTIKPREKRRMEKEAASMAKKLGYDFGRMALA